MDRGLRLGALLYAAGLVLHTADHYRRGVDTVTAQVQWLGTLGLVLGVAAIVLVLLRHPRAPLAAAVVGLSKAAGVSAVHLLPRWSAFSDAFPGNAVDPVTWAAVFIEIAGALAMGLAGLALLRQRDLAHPA